MHAVITGAADGIGRALAVALAQNGYDITGLDIDEERAHEAEALINSGPGRASFIPTDLSDPASLQAALDILEEGPQIDLLIHNAGISAVGPFESLGLERQKAVIDINLLAPMLITPHLLYYGKITTGGSIVFISSLSHYTGYPGAAAYAASKDGLASYARSLLISLTDREINVLTVFPGPTRTAHARRYSPDNSREDKRMAPDALAQQIITAINKRQRRLIPGAGNRAVANLGHYWPGGAEWLMKKLLWEKINPKS